MRKKASKNIQLVLITSVLASCGQPAQQAKDTDKQRVFMRADSTAAYTEVTDNYNNSSNRSGGSGGMGTSLLWFMAFRHMGGVLGYANNSIHPSSVSGTNARKADAYKAQRGGFGNTANSNSSVGA
ncbi:hypothetical protein [Sphingobacterium psychroaquaticum]|uniref:Uncharacterized protein n=1 Tax=Sphingobacterium psychroaquaticum TaxID=561061 RepID=A0A1X7HWI3_9SPHI|nr:hypothetical protein [Sphingobacterium psychroaquaticum]QBQ42102.1 hypothetical protein E2P86_13450 [Sphingobacterium psychroaquaticum]SMG05941.1 hypothetical protein SAMN05660862_0097 [Sphingobacterium psychroaquaticum]